jgi:phenylalanyl-tRNA synthetase alpha chain
MKYTNENIDKLYNEIQADSKTLSAEEFKKKFLSKEGEVKNLLSEISTIEASQRAIFGQEVNSLKTFAQETLESLQNSIQTEDQDSNSKEIDVTAPFDINVKAVDRPATINKKGTIHPLSQELNTILDIFKRMGFNIEDSRQLDNDYNMFEALNIPEGHPARDVWDTFWTEERLIPPAHTSTMQNRILKKYKTPIRAVIPGRCFRNEATDANHEHTLHQIEGVYVDENISLGDMLGTIKTYLEEFFGQELQIRIQPAFFPFTEPDMEFMISCPLCNATGCPTCSHSGWMEAMGCGMIHPNVLEEAGLDSKKYTGFAWGFGLDRLVMLKNKIEDIRWLHSGDLDFLKQFKS